MRCVIQLSILCDVYNFVFINLIFAQNVMIIGQRHQRPSSPMSTDSNMSPAITHKRPKRHKHNQSGQQGCQPKDVFNDGKD